MPMVTCWKCKHQVSEADFCSFCGAALVPQKEEIIPPAYTPVSPTNNYNTSSSSSYSSSGQSSNVNSSSSYSSTGIPTSSTSTTASRNTPMVIRPNQKASYNPHAGSRRFNDSEFVEPEYHTKIVSSLKSIYKKVVKPLELSYKFEAFHSAPLSDADIDARPMVLLFGSYSVGKTTIIEYLTEKSVGHIGPEPTTDRFMAITYGSEHRSIQGNAAAVMDNKPFQGQQKFGLKFLNRFECVETPSEQLKNITLIDTPGILSGEKQRIGREYDFTEVIRYWCNKVDRIQLIFDAYKLDIGDELKSAIECIQGNEEKVRCILNKADTVSGQNLLRCYGALMWSISRVIKTPEAFRVYLCSLWNQPYRITENEHLLNAEEAELLSDLKSLPRHSIIRKLNQMIKRVKQLKIHTLIISYMASKIGFFGKRKDQDKILDNLLEHFYIICKEHSIPHNDMPNINAFKSLISSFKVWEFPTLNKKTIQALDNVLSVDIPELMKLLPGDDTQRSRPDQASLNFQGNGDDLGPPAEDLDANPFEDAADEPEVSAAIHVATQQRYRNLFFEQKTSSGKISANQAKGIMSKSGLSNKVLSQIWKVADLDKDSALDIDEFILAMSLLEACTNNAANYNRIPPEDSIPVEFIPSFKREMYYSRFPAARQVSLGSHPQFDILSSNK